MSLSKALIYKGGELEKPKIWLLAPNRVAPININGATIHSGLGINVGGKLYPLSEQHRAALRNKLSEVRLIIIDEISMVSNLLFFQVNQRLTEIFRYSGKEPFAGLPYTVCGDKAVQHIAVQHQLMQHQVIAVQHQLKAFLH